MTKLKVLFFSLLILGLSQISCKKNDESILDCSTVTISYSNNIVPILNSSCNTAACHDNGNQNGDFTDYDGIKEAANSGSLMNRVITNQTMPLSSSLSQEQLDQFECWLNANAPNN